MNPRRNECHIYEGVGDDLMEMEQAESGSRILLVPDAPTEQRDPEARQHVRIMWGQRLIDDVIAGRYRTLVCAVNARDNGHGFINLLAQRLPASQWTEPLITAHARRFVQPHKVIVVKYDMDPVEVLALLRPHDRDQMTLADLSAGFRIVSAMLAGRPDRFPVASVCFLGARANRLVNGQGREPSFEAVLRTMYDAGYRGDVYPAPWMWESTAGVFPRYPFPESLKQRCEGGF